MGYYSRKRGMIEIQGRLQEDAAVRKIGGDAINVNDLAGENFQTYDLISSDGIYSVKSHMSIEGEFTDSAKKAYLNNFSRMIGRSGSIDSVENDAKALIDKLPAGSSMPKEIANANLQQTTEYLKNKSVLCIPEDHVAEMRELLKERAKQFPENYYLPENPTEEQLNALTERIQGTGLTGVETASQAQEVYQRQEEEFQRASIQEKENLTSDLQVAGEERDRDLDDDYCYGLGM